MDISFNNSSLQYSITGSIDESTALVHHSVIEYYSILHDRVKLAGKIPNVKDVPNALFSFRFTVVKSKPGSRFTMLLIECVNVSGSEHH